MLKTIDILELTYALDSSLTSQAKSKGSTSLLEGVNKYQMQVQLLLLHLLTYILVIDTNHLCAMHNKMNWMKIKVDDIMDKGNRLHLRDL